ncbi:hypothetical protein CAEBREN_11462 [Caenorhabditis brenneri]|uniref:Major sperm protein n=1 Tax=Caenorhabditis brenneri TaxID=135651 RepID=G0MUB3_CAEBE|nr:hypothetical protein CAEBREN_11462 [Caenorhabditis brenneri]
MTPISGEFSQNMQRTPLVIHEGNIQKEFEKLHKDGKPILKTESKYVVFCGFPDLQGDRACVHMELRNETAKTFLFNIRTPISPNFFVKPHVGMVEPAKSVTLYFTFKAKCHRIPSDYCWIYSIYHIPIDDKSVAWIKEDEFSSSNLRTVWNERGKDKNIENILHLSCKFDGKAKPKTECKRHKINLSLFLNAAGEVMVEETGQKAEASSTPGNSQAQRTKKTPSLIDSTDELPKTANSEKKIK